MPHADSDLRQSNISMNFWSLRFVCLLFIANFAHADLAEGRRQFATLCASCHGADGGGGEKGPAIRASRRRSARSIEDLKQIIVQGIPQRGMPGFQLPEARVLSIAEFVRSLGAPAIESQIAGDTAAGRTFFFDTGGCAKCHMVGGSGGLIGPDLSNIARERTLSEIEQSLRQPEAVVARGYEAVTVTMRNGQTVDGIAKNESNFDMQVQDRNAKLHLLLSRDIANVKRSRSLMPPVATTNENFQNVVAFLSKLGGNTDAGSKNASRAEAAEFERLLLPASGDWPTYNGMFQGNRHSQLKEIHRGNIGSLAPRWIFPVPGAERLQVTPVVVDGVMYVTNVNQVFAVDAATGRQIWQYRRDRTRGMAGDAASGINRGVAVMGDRVFLYTDNAHLIALHRITGALLWEVETADYKQNYGLTAAPLVVNDLVISGSSGGDEGVRGFIAAYRADTGEKVWQFWTVPAPGEPGSETWKGSAIEHGCAAAWLTGTYDPEAKLLYWPTGNPCPDYNGDERKGDNLYSSSVVALDPETGKLRWHFQFTPHDLHDWDAVQTPVLVDAPFRGRPRKLLLHANRNGFFYVLDRLTGEFLHASPFAKQTWAKEIDAKGRPVLLPNTEPTPGGTAVCPAVEGATNWMSPAFHPGTGLYYVMSLDKCSVYTKTEAVWKAGESFYGGGTRSTGEPGRKFLRAIEVETGKIRWEIPQAGPGNTWGGVLTTEGGLVFYGDDSGAFAASDAQTGAPLWHFHTNQLWKASPMTYTANGKQYVAVAAGGNVIAFGLP